MTTEEIRVHYFDDKCPGISLDCCRQEVRPVF
jgi:hypothetical protein